MFVEISPSHLLACPGVIFSRKTSPCPPGALTEDVTGILKRTHSGVLICQILKVAVLSEYSHFFQYACKDIAVCKDVAVFLKMGTTGLFPSSMAVMALFHSSAKPSKSRKYCARSALANAIHMSPNLVRSTAVLAGMVGTCTPCKLARAVADWVSSEGGTALWLSRRRTHCVLVPVHMRLLWQI